MGTAVAALGVAELTSGIDRRFASPITQVGNRVIDAAPPWLKTFAIENFGTNDKQVLIGSVMVLLAIFAIVLTANLLGDAVRDVLDPRLQQ